MEKEFDSYCLGMVDYDIYSKISTLQHTQSSIVKEDPNQCDLYCLEMINYDILSMRPSKSSSDPFTQNKTQINAYCAYLLEHDIFNILQSVAHLIVKAPSDILYPLLEPYFEASLLSQTTRNKLQNGFVNHGINGKTLRFIDEECLCEMGIMNDREHNIILAAINQIYLIFNPFTQYTFDILYKYMMMNNGSVYNYNTLQNIIGKQQLNGETLMYINKTCLDEMHIIDNHTRNAIFSAIYQIFDSETFSSYISTFPHLSAYNSLFIRHNIDLSVFRNNVHSDIFYANIGIKDKRTIYAFKHLFPEFATAEYVVECCNSTCAEMCIFSRDESLDDLYVYGYYGYKMQPNTLQNEDTQIEYRLVNGEYIRIFCSQCDSTLKQCACAPQCNNYDVFEICATHPSCKECADKLKMAEKCISCDFYFCCDCLLETIERWYFDDVSITEADSDEIAKQCKSCILKGEIDEITHALSAINVIRIWENIGYIIASYSVGIILTCCNTTEHPNHTKEIAFNSRWEYYYRTDCDNNEIYYYNVEAPPLYHSISMIRDINGTLIRMFCAYCTNKKIKTCTQCCYNMDTNKHCANHMLCCDCGAEFKYKTYDATSDYCAGCHKFCCGSCRVIMRNLNQVSCESCFVKFQYKTIYESLSSSKPNMREYILHLITEFALGYALKCCNKEDKCTNTIIMNNISQFRRKLDCNQHKIYHYEALYTRANKPTIIMNEERYRIFCAECNEYKLDFCACFQQFESGNKECLKHPVCGSCNIVIIEDEPSACTDCDVNVCMNCVCLSNNGNALCKECGHKEEVHYFAHDISQILRYNTYRRIPSMDCLHIAGIIASFAIGFILKCSNNGDIIKKCNDIIFDDKASVEKNKDYQNKVISYYKVPWDYYKGTVTMCIFGGKFSRNYRIFCDDCNSDVITCRYPSCDNKDISETCALHAVCSQCKCFLRRSGNKRKSCGKCNEWLCYNCWIKDDDEYVNIVYCEPCLTADEYNSLHRVLCTTTTIGIYINRIIAEYAFGYVFCCGNTDGCENEIIFRSLHQFQKKYDVNHQSIYYYRAVYKRNKQIVSIQSTDYRLFCGDCSSTKQTKLFKPYKMANYTKILRRCRECRKHLEPSGALCCDHPACKQCNRVINGSPIFCKTCDICLCPSCRVSGSNLCADCITKDEVCHYADILHDVLHYIQRNIINIIAEYCVGYIFGCCNAKKKCDETIICDNKLQLLSGKDFKHRKITCNDPEYFIASRPIVSVLWDGALRKMRVFCFKCTNSELVRCNKCANRLDVHTICGRHPICGNCNQLVSNSGTVKCCVCYETCCQQCCYSIGYTDDIIYCKKCIKKGHYEALYGPIYEAIQVLNLGFELNIIGIMMDYCIGYAFECGNKEENCENDIVFDNMLQFRKKQDIHKQEIYYYYTDLQKKHLVDDRKPTIYIDGKEMRIFCFVCFNYRTKRCKLCPRHVANYDIPDVCNNRICVNHPQCSSCDIATKCSLCRGCDAYFCTKRCCVDIIGRKYCKHCAITKERNDYLENISDSPIWNELRIYADKREICRVIAAYSVGFILECFNGTCCNTIVVNNIWQFKQKKDSENKSITWRHLSKKKKRGKQVQILLRYDRVTKVFCSYCHRIYG